MTKLLRILIPEVLIAFLPVIVYTITFNSLPKIITTHYSIMYGADSFAYKWSLSVLFVVLLGFIGLVIGQILVLFAKVFPRIVGGNNQEADLKVANFASVFLTILSSLIGILFLIFSLASIKLSAYLILRITMAILGIIDVFIGNFIPKIKKNYIVGIRLPSTLKNKQLWYMTHHFSGRLMMIGGIIQVIIGILIVIPNITAIVMQLSLYPVMILIILFYSINHNKQHIKKE